LKNFIKYFFSSVIIIGCLELYGQVNTESLRKKEISDGVYTKITLNYGNISGNSNFQNLKTGIRSDVVYGDFSAFLVMNLNRVKKEERLFIDKGFAHLRGMKKISPIFAGEVFIQKGYDDFIMLQSRDLAGGGLRLKLDDWFTSDKSVGNPSFFLGIGGMWESEKLTIPYEDKTTIRSTNYFSAKYKQNNIGFTSTIYYQFDIWQLSDYRILASGALEISITKKIGFITEIQYRFDSEPPPDIVEYDLEIVNGITLNF